MVSYYATEALLTANTTADWLASIQRLVALDSASGRLPAWLQPNLTLLGNPDTAAPGL